MPKVKIKKRKKKTAPKAPKTLWQKVKAILTRKIGG